LDLLKSLGLNVNFKDALFFEIRNEDRQFAEKFIFKNDLKKKVLVGFAPCVGLKQQFKRWPKDNFVELGRKILDSYTDSFILIFGSFSEKEFCSKIKSDLGKNTMEITDFSLKQVAALIDKCKVFVASDCGLGHIATTTNTNLISIFGPTISERTGPYIHVAKVQIISEKCNYQYHDIYRAKNYDATRQHQCLIKITPDKVFSKVKEILVK